MECLIKAGAFDRLGNNRHSHVEAVEGILKSIETDTRRNLDGQLDLFSVMSGGEQDAAQEDRWVVSVKPSPCRWTRSSICSSRVARSGMVRDWAWRQISSEQSASR